MDHKQVVAILRKIPFFEGLDDQTLKFIAEFGTAVNVSAGTVLFNEGDLGDTVYLIIKGKIEVYRTVKGDYDSVLAVLTTSDILGEMSLLDDLPRSASAKVLENAVLIRLTRFEFQAFLEQHFSVALKLLNTLSRKLREANEKLTERKRRGYFPENR